MARSRRVGVLVALVLAVAAVVCVSAAEESDAFDDEEFVGLEVLNNAEPAGAGSGVAEDSAARPPTQAAAQTADPVANFSMLPKDFTLEIVYGSVIVVYITVYLVGRSNNKAISARVFDAVLPILREQFHLVSESAVADSLSEYHALATGRANCDGAMATLDLLRRQDLYSIGWSMFVAKKEDTFTLDVVLPEGMPPVVLAVVHESERKAFVKDYPDVQSFTRGYGGRNVQEPLSVLCDSEDAMKMLLTNDVVSVLNRLSRVIRVIHITDSNKRMNHKQTMRVRFVLPPDDKDMGVLINMSLYFVDLVSRVQLTKSSLERAKKVRAAAAEKEWKAQSAQRQELAQQKKQERLQKAKAELEKLPPEMQEKILEKRMRKAQKQRGPKMKVMHG